MNAIQIIRVGVLGCALTLTSAVALAVDKPAAKAAPAKETKAAKPAPAGNDQKAMMDAMQRMGEVRPEHKQLDYFTGEWKATTTMWMDPKAAPQKSEGKTHAESKFGGRYVEMQHEGKFQDQAFSGEGLI